MQTEYWYKKGENCEIIIIERKLRKETTNISMWDFHYKLTNNNNNKSRVKSL